MCQLLIPNLGPIHLPRLYDEGRFYVELSYMIENMVEVQQPVVLFLMDIIPANEVEYSFFLTKIQAIRREVANSLRLTFNNRGLMGYNNSARLSLANYVSPFNTLPHMCQQIGNIVDSINSSLTAKCRFALLLSYALKNKVVFTDHLITEARNAPKWIFNEEKQLCIQQAKKYMDTLFEPAS
ncbi:Uncharacterised protein [Legionella feeleii]|uniref:Uncharacterized protein n=2 Tax=Legionella feeleii TaxID=453 RepID=A0A378IZV5_9GAMM|nr:Uncharacterised protein [Legionella feeleii]